MPPKSNPKAAPQVKSIAQKMAQKRKAQEEKQAESPTPSKRSKKPDSGGDEKTDASPTKPITPAKSVINLHDAVLKVSPEAYINPSARKLFKDVEVPHSYDTS
jgi:hypothetical protein